MLHHLEDNGKTFGGFSATLEQIPEIVISPDKDEVSELVFEVNFMSVTRESLIDVLHPRTQ